MTPSPFVVQWLERLAAESPRPRVALDLAMGAGRHVQPLARAGYTIVDRSLSDLQEARDRERGAGTRIRCWCADLTTHPLPRARFDLVLVTRYLQRDLFDAIREALKPGAFVVYETFTRRQLLHDRGPRSSDHLLEPGELQAFFESFQSIFYEEVDEPEAVARLVARRPMAASRAYASGGSTTPPSATDPGATSP
jgi:SAM-dependent methyltransferase